jgi:hypothetical protein
MWSCNLCRVKSKDSAEVNYDEAPKFHTFSLLSASTCRLMSKHMIAGEHRIQTFQLKNERPTWRHLLFYFTSYVLNMFRTLIYPSSGACDCVVELPHRSFCSQFVVCWRFGAAGFGLCSFYRLNLQPAKRTPLKTYTTIPDAILIQFDILMMSTELLETCRGL